MLVVLNAMIVPILFKKTSDSLLPATIAGLVTKR